MRPRIQEANGPVLHLLYVFPTGPNGTPQGVSTLKKTVENPERPTLRPGNLGLFGVPLSIECARKKRPKADGSMKM